MEWLWLTLLSVCCLAGIVLALFQLPGLWLVIGSATAYDGLHDWKHIGWPWLIGLFLAAAAVETFDFLAGVLAARRAGASRRAAFGALIGGFIGMMLFSVPIPIPGLGAVIGGLTGCFLGALAGELTLKRDLQAGVRVGLFATIGRAVGLAAKTSACVVIAGTVLSLATWSSMARP